MSLTQLTFRLKAGEENMEKKYVTGRCVGCKNMRIVYGGGWRFPACYHLPYNGKWCCEIKQCPKKQKPAGN